MKRFNLKRHAMNIVEVQEIILKISNRDKHIFVCNLVKHFIQQSSVNIYFNNRLPIVLFCSYTLHLLIYMEFSYLVLMLVFHNRNNSNLNQ
jgi:hypothetical protein